MGTVFIAPGHGRRPNGTIDPGAVGGGTNEQEAGDIFCRLLEDFLENNFEGFSLDRQPKGGPNFSGTIEVINEKGYSVSGEFHHDWSGAPRGGFGFHTNGDQRSLANLIHAHYKEEGLPTRPHMVNLPGSSSPPAIMTRTDYLTILWELDRIGSIEDWQPYVRAVGNGFAEYLKLSPKVSETPPPDADGGSNNNQVDEKVITLGDGMGNRTHLREMVKSWQRDLTRLYGSGVLGPAGVDGKFGPRTRTATLRFYTDHGLSASDSSAPRVGTRSRKVMEDALRRRTGFTFRHSDTLREGAGLRGQENLRPAVAEWQEAIMLLLGEDALGNYGADGKFGPTTREATRRAFQATGAARNPAANPVVGPNSRRAMQDALNR